MAGMRNEHLSLEGHPDAESLAAIAGRAPTGPLRRLPAALEILATRMREAMASRRGAPPGSEQYQRADELVVYLNELYLRLQRRMQVPAEIWLLDGGSAPVHGRRAPRPDPRWRDEAKRLSADHLVAQNGRDDPHV